MVSFTILASSALSFMAVQTDGFAPSPKKQQLKRIPALNNAADADATDARINQSIDLDSPKVVTQDKLESGKKVYCRCWQSGTFPLCDGAHVAHNKETGDNVGPLILAVAKAEAKPSAATEEKVEVAATEVVAAVAVVEDDDKKSTSLFGKFKALFKNKNDDGTSTKEKLAKMGLSALLSYGFVSNMSYAVALSLSWYGFSKKTGLSPLAPGQWKPFLAVYAGFYVFNNIVRPVRFGLSVAVAKYFDAAVEKIQTKTKLSRKWSIAVVVFLANVCGTFAAMGLGVSVASGAAGVPIFPPKVVV